MNKPLMNIGELAELLGGAQVRGSPRIGFTSVAIDTRTIEPKGLFFAIKGERDGHDFVQAAADANAAAAVVSHPVPVSIPQIIVPDPRQALLNSASIWRRRFEIPVIAIAGSNGKTTTTQMILSILKERYDQGHWVGTQGNLNNELGVALSLWRLRPEHEIAAFEVGMNHIGEMASIVSAIAPTISTVTNTMRDHQQFLASLEDTAKENGEVFVQLPRSGVAVINARDPFEHQWRLQAGNRRIVTFGTDGSDVFAGSRNGTNFILYTPVGNVAINLPIPGAHNVNNAVCAAAVMFARGIDPIDIKKGLENFSPVSHRGEVKKLKDGSVIIDDSYNANPDSMIAAVGLLVEYGHMPTIFVMGDMAELGAQSPQAHREIGEFAKTSGVKELFCLGNRTMDASEAFGEGARHFETREELLRALLEQLEKEPHAILFKASNFMRLYQVADALRQEIGKKETENKKDNS